MKFEVLTKILHDEKLYEPAVDGDDPTFIDLTKEQAAAMPHAVALPDSGKRKGAKQKKAPTSDEKPEGDEDDDETIVE